MTQEMQKTEDSKAIAPMTPGAVHIQVQLIQGLMKEVMIEGTHFGTIPGCGEKKILFKSGAEKLGLTFRLAPSYRVERIDLGNMHREYEIRCVLTHINTGQIWGEGVGSCSTMEIKYRYRSGEKTMTDRPVPKEYWDMRKIDPAKAQRLIGAGAGTKKGDGGQWFITEGSGEKVENPDPADVYNTVLKMAKKRAHVDATLTATAASDLFEQDLEDGIDFGPEAEKKAADNAKPVDAHVEDVPPPQEPPDQKKPPKDKPKAKAKEKPKDEPKPHDEKADKVHYIETVYKPLSDGYKSVPNAKPIEAVVANINPNAKNLDDLTLKEIKDVARMLTIEKSMAEEAAADGMNF